MDAYSMLGQLYAVQNRLDEARVELERLAGLSPSSAIGAHTLVGMILQAQNKPKEAQARYEKVVQMNPRAAVASNNLAWLYAEGGGNLDVALQLAQAAHAQLIDNPQVNDTLGWVYYKKGLSTKAVASFRESLEQAGGNPVYQYHLGLAYAQRGDKQEARKALEQALQLNPKFEGAADVRRLLAEMKG
jgi:tetratricopeptide (TPR) repeat protein